MAYSSSVSDEVQEEINPKKDEKEGSTALQCVYCNNV
jgi:hypothetical protein